MNRSVKIKRLVCFLATVIALSTGVHFLHAFQVKRHAGMFLARADRAEADHDLDKAAAYLARYVASVPDDVDTRARYGLLLVQTATTPQAEWQTLSLLENLLRQAPDRHDVRRKLVDLAIHLDRFSDARDHLENLITAFPEEGALEQKLAHCEEAEGHYDEAAAAFKRAIDKKGADKVGCAVSLAKVLRHDLDQPSEADRVMNDLVSRHATFQAYLARAAYYKGIGSAKEAAKDVRQAVKLAPDEADVILAEAELSQSAAQAAHDPGKLDTARGILRRGLKLHPQNVRFHQALAALELQAGNPREALRWLRQGLKVAARPSVDELWRLAELLIEAGEVEGPDGARTIISRLRKLGSQPEVLGYLDARVLMTEQQWAQAREKLEVARLHVMKSPELAKQTDLLLAQCYRALGSPDQAILAYRRALKIDALWLPARQGLASAFAAVGRTDEAITEYRAMLDRDPAIRIALARALIDHNLSVPREERRWGEVEELLAVAGRQLPDAVEIPILQAQVLVGRDPRQLPAARDLLDKARKQYPRRVEIYIALADLAESQQDVRAAHVALDQAEARAGDHVLVRLARAQYAVRRQGRAAAGMLAKLEQALDQFKPADQVQLLSGLARAYVAIGKSAEAERLWEAVAKREPYNLYVRLALFDFALEAGNDAAMQRRQTGIRQIEGDSGDLWRYCEAARLLVRARGGDLEGLAEARSRLTGIGSRRPSWSRVPLLEGEIDELQGNMERALEHYQTAIRLGEQQPQLIRRVVGWLYERKRFVEADQVIQILTERHAIVGDLGRVAAETAFRNQDPERALRFAQQAVSADSKDYRDQIWLGQIKWAARQPQEAEKAFRRATELAGNVPDPWVALIQFLVQTKDQAKAEAAIQRARRQLPPAQAPLALAQCYEGLGRVDQAAKYYRAALAANADDAATLRTSASFYLRHDKATEGERLLHRLLDPRVKARKDDLAWARRNIAIRLVATGKRGNADKALALLELNVQAGADTIDDRRAKALVLSTEPARHKEAIDILGEVIRRQPIPEDRFVLAQLYEAVDEPQAAREQLLRLVGSPDGDKPRYIAAYVRNLLRHADPRSAEPWLAELEKREPGMLRTIELKARWLQARGKDKEAADLLKTFARDHRDRGTTLIAALLEETGQAQAAEDLFRKAAQETATPENTLALAGYLGRQNRLKEALDLCQRAWQKLPPEQVAVVSVSVLRNPSASKEDYDRVEGWLKAAIKSHPRQTALEADLASLWVLRGRYADAKAHYREVLERNPQDILAMNNLAWLLVLGDRDHAEALRLVNQAIHLAGPLPSLLDTRALAYMAAEQREPAIRDLNRALSERRTPTMYFHLAEAHLLAQNLNSAREALDKAKAAGLSESTLEELERDSYRRVLDQLERK